MPFGLIFNHKVQKKKKKKRKMYMPCGATVFLVCVCVKKPFS